METMTLEIGTEFGGTRNDGRPFWGSIVSVKKNDRGTLVVIQTESDKYKSVYLEEMKGYGTYRVF